MSRSSPFPLPPPPIRNRWVFFCVLALGLAGFMAVWYGALRDTGSGEPEYGGDYTEGMLGAPGRVNPLFAGMNAVDQSLVSLIFAGLTRLVEAAGGQFSWATEVTGWRVGQGSIEAVQTTRGDLSAEEYVLAPGA